MIEKSDEVCDAQRRIRKIHGETHTIFEELSTNTVAKFRELNIKLTDYEKKMRLETQDLMTYAYAKIKDVNNTAIDFEILIVVRFYLSLQDPAYLLEDNTEEENNLLTVLQTTKYKNVNWNWSYGDNNCHNAIPNRTGTLIENDIHCAIFHALYDHTNLSYEEISRIGSCTLDMNLHFQYKQKEL